MERNMTGNKNTHISESSPEKQNNHSELQTKLSPPAEIFSRDYFLSWKTRLTDICFLMVLALTICFLYRVTPYRWMAYYAASDPRYALLVSQAMIQQQTVALDNYIQLDSERKDVLTHNGHLYYYFPIGSSLLALPAVYAGCVLGLDMSSPKDDFHLQFLLALFSALFVTCGMYLIVRTITSPFISLLLIFFLTFGSPLIVTLLTAFWSHNAALICCVTAGLFLLLADRSASKRKQYCGSYCAGVMAGLAYVCRPTFSLFCVVVVALSLRASWRRTLVVCSGIATVMGMFVAFSQFVYSSWLPPYYISSRLSNSPISMLTALCGNLISPSRGILVQAPLSGLIVCMGVLACCQRKLSILGIASLIWYLLHLTAISQFPHWWAGWSYGARLQTDVMPALMIVGAEIISCSKAKYINRYIAVGLIILLGTWGVWVHSYQGVLNPNTAKWCKVLDIDHHPNMIWSWQYPQFLASAESVKEMGDVIMQSSANLRDGLPAN